MKENQEKFDCDGVMTKRNVLHNIENSTLFMP